jgi:cbb3-type cytochrome oxidase maturation protein
MNILVVLIPVSLGLGLLALAGFLWTLRSDQYSDMEGDAMRILEDDDQPPEERG